MAEAEVDTGLALAEATNDLNDLGCGFWESVLADGTEEPAFTFTVSSCTLNLTGVTIGLFCS